MPSFNISCKGDWEPLVGDSLWFRVQSILDGKAAPLQVTHRIANDGFILRGLLVYAGCGKLMTGSTSKSDKGHAYYHCVATRHPRVRVKAAMAAVTTRRLAVSSRDSRKFHSRTFQ
jgi:hypothetical protein